MPDNISLTTSDINSLKNIQGRALIRLDQKTFAFNPTGRGNPNLLPIIPDGTTTQGMRVFAATRTVKPTKNGLGYEIDVNDFASVKTPAVFVTLTSSDSNISTYQLYGVGSYTSGKVIVKIFSPKGTAWKNTGIQVTINVLLIGYA